jgi:hypothetical protein
MKFMEKVYRRFCADEVRLMLDHMEDNFVDFDDHNNKWSEIFCANEYTFAERAALGFAYTRLKKNQKRQKLLASILSQKLNPEKVEQVPKVSLTSIHNQILASQQSIYNNQLAQYAQQHQQHLQTHEEYARQQANMLYGKQP